MTICKSCKENRAFYSWSDGKETCSICGTLKGDEGKYDGK